MQIIGIPTEQTTALTDFILGLVVVGGFIFFYRFRKISNTPKIKIWLSMFGLLAFASILGAAAHGFAMSKEVNFWLWQPINLALGLVVALFVTATVFDLFGEAAYRKVQLPMVGVAVLFYVTTLLIRGTFLPFILYEAVAMLFALVGYMLLAARKQLTGAWWTVAGILITIIAAVIQAVGATGVVLFLGLDHNGVFHLTQLFGILALMVGLQNSLQKVSHKVSPAILKYNQ